MPHVIGMAAVTQATTPAVVAAWTYIDYKRGVIKLQGGYSCFLLVDQSPLTTQKTVYVLMRRVFEDIKAPRRINSRGYRKGNGGEGHLIQNCLSV